MATNFGQFGPLTKRDIGFEPGEKLFKNGSNSPAEKFGSLGGFFDQRLCISSILRPGRKDGDCWRRGSVEEFHHD